MTPDPLDLTEQGQSALELAASATQAFLDSYSDESELARWSPELVKLMRDYAALLRRGLALESERASDEQEREG